MNRKEAPMLIPTDVYWLVLTEHKHSRVLLATVGKWWEAAPAPPAPACYFTFKDKLTNLFCSEQLCSYF